MDKDDTLQDLFPDLLYTLLMQLGGSQGPEAVSPVLKTWRLIHTGTLPEEINLQRCSQGLRAGRGLGQPPPKGPCHPLLVGRRSLWKLIILTTLPPVCPAQGRPVVAP